jgi:membrane protein implicated in regulation of membrane protease activity
MTWGDFYLVCFVVGFLLSIVIFLTGRAHFHVPHAHIHLPGLHVHASAHTPAHTAAGTHPGADQISPFNLITLTAFLAWFGGTGYLLARHSTIWFFTSLVVSLLSGMGGAAIVYLFLARVLTSPDEALDPADFDMVGVLGKLSAPIREGGTGELIYSQMGTRRVCGARSEAGAAIPKATEVVVTRYERGLAYVRPWSELAGEDAELSAAETNQAEEQRRMQ